MEAQASALVTEVHQACEQEPSKQTLLLKQRLYSRVGQFLMGSLDMRHWWCNYPALMTFMMRLLELYPSSESVVAFYNRMARQLGACSQCVDIYHASLPSVYVELGYEFTLESTKAFFYKISQLDAERIRGQLSPKPQPGSLNLTSDRHATAAASLALYEVLSQRRLLSDFRIVRVLSKWVSSPMAMAIDSLNLERIRKCGGLYQLLVSPDPSVREWAKMMVEHSGKIQLAGDDGEDKAFFDVLDEWVFILEGETFNMPVMSLELESTKGLVTFLEPMNCVKTPTNQTLWAALDTVMQQMDESSLEAMLESFDTLPDLVFNYLNAADPATTNQQITLVICKCYGVLLRCLGHRFWKHTVNSQKVVLDLVVHHCEEPAWRVFVTKQLIDLLPPLLASMRPPQISSNESNQAKLRFYFQTREKLLLFLMVKERRPAHFADLALSVASSRAAFTMLNNCYEHRLSGAASGVPSGKAARDEGALPDSISIDFSVSDSAFWWPCGSGAGSGVGCNLEQLWMHHLFNVVVSPKNVESLVDHAAVTVATILNKHLQLARDVVYTNLVSSDGESTVPVEAITKSKPIVTGLLTKLCAWNVVATIPLPLHGALFESIGGISELLNAVEAQASPSHTLQTFAATLRDYESHVQSYLQRMCEEVLQKGLADPFRFPVVAQHINTCLLSPRSTIDLSIKRLLGHYARNKKDPTKTPSSLEAVLIAVYRDPEPFLRGQLSMLQSMRLYGFSLAVCLPAMKKLVFVWSRVFSNLGGALKKAFDKASTGGTGSSMAQQVTDVGVAAAHLLKLPNLINDFLIAILSGFYDPTKTELRSIAESTRVQCLDFGIEFWKFWTSTLNDPSASTKRVTALLPPLVECISAGPAAEKKRAAELLMMVLTTFLNTTTPLDETTLQMVDSIKDKAASIASDLSTDFGRMTKKFRKMDKASQFFSKRGTVLTGRPRALSLTSASSTSSRRPSDRSSVLESSEQSFSRRPAFTKASSIRSRGSDLSMSNSKAAARKQDQRRVDLTGIEEIAKEAEARRQHSFFAEEEYHKPTKKEASTAQQNAKSRTVFDMSQVIKGIAHSHPGSNKTVRAEGPRSIEDEKAHDRDEESEEEEDPGLQFAALFHRIKTTRKPIAVCSLLPFYRQLLQVCMPTLLSREFEQQRSDKVLVAPDLTFKKSAEYVRAFLPLLLEECNNEVQEGLRRCSSGGSRGHLLRYDSEKPREGMRCISLSIVQKDEGLLASGQSKFGRKGRPAFNEKLFRNGDIVLLQIAAGSQNQSGFMGKREFIGVILISEAEKGRRRTTNTKKNSKDEEEESIKVLFLNDGELESVTSDVRSFSMEMLTASAIADSEWKVNPLCNLVTSAREYIALRSVDMLPEHLRTTILTPNTYKSTQSELIVTTKVLDNLRAVKSSKGESKITKLLKRLDKMDVMLTDLRSTSIGKAVNKLRKHDNSEIKGLAQKLKDKWTGLMDKTDALENPPRFLAGELWEAIKPQYNQSQLQSIHSVLNNYSMGVSLLQGPPGTGKTKTIMGLLSGLLALRPPATAVMPVASAKLGSSTKNNEASGEFNNFQAARSRGTNGAASNDQSSSRAGSQPAFSLSGVTSALGSILRRPCDSMAANQPSRSSIQALKNKSSARGRLEDKLLSRSTQHPASSSLVIKRRVVSSTASVRSMDRSNNILLCAPSNGAVNELVLRIVTDGLMDSTGAVTKVRAPSVHPEALSQEWISIVRLGNAGEDAPDVVHSVCLPHIIRREMAVHPKAMELHALQDTQKKLRSSIHDFHNNPKDSDKTEGGKPNRKALAKMHQKLTECSGKIRRLRDEVFALRSKMTEAILSKASIIACTLSKAGSGDFSGLKRGFDALIIDEAAQAVELSTLVPIRERVARVVLVGDPKQLPATVKSVVAANAHYDRSLFERIAESGVAPSMLRVQYRMHPFMRDFPSKQFYGGMLADGPSVMERVQKVCPGVYAYTAFQPFLLYDVENSREEDMNGSKYNRTEATFCIKMCQTMFETCADVRRNNWNVGFVSPYKEQVRVLRQEITRSAMPVNISVEVNTVDGFQGREKDVIIFSCVRASRRGGIGFLRDIRRLNVAITRARFCLYVVGNVNTLVRDETWAALVRSARDRKLIIRSRGEEFPAVAKRLASDENRDLAMHFKVMHEKSVRKATTTISSSSAKPPITETSKPASSKPEASDRVETGEEKQHDEKMKESFDTGMHQPGGQQTARDGTSASVDLKTEPPLQSRSAPARDPRNGKYQDVDMSSDHHKRTAEQSLDDTGHKVPRVASDSRSASDGRSRSDSRSPRDHSSSSARQPRREKDSSRSYDRGKSSHSRDRGGSSNGQYGHEDARDSRGNSRDSRRSGSASSQRQQYGRDDRGDRSRWGQDRARNGDRRAPADPMPREQSISAKEFCQVNEPPRPSRNDRPRSTTSRVVGKRPFEESKYPPPKVVQSKHHAATQQHRGQFRDQASRRNNAGSSNHRGTATKTDTNGSRNGERGRGDRHGGGVLGNILGSASQLASAASRVNDKAGTQASEFS